jgi:hypothetical protein
MDFTLELPILDNSPQESAAPPKVFTADELAVCADGECCRCSRCCFLYDVLIPRDAQRVRFNSSIATNQRWFSMKAENTLCPHMSWDEEGRSTCACHAEKDAPVLQMCREFSGADGMYQFIVNDVRDFFLTPSSSDEVRVLQDWYARGLLSDIGEPLRSAEELRWFLTATLSRIQVLPRDLYEFAKIPEWLGKLSASQLQSLLTALEIDCENPVGIHREFVDAYLTPAGLPEKLAD